MNKKKIGMVGIAIGIAVILVIMGLPYMKYSDAVKDSPSVVDYSVMAYMANEFAIGQFGFSADISHNETSYWDYFGDYWSGFMDTGAIGKGDYVGPIIMFGISLDGEPYDAYYEFYTFGDTFDYESRLWTTQGTSVTMNMVIYLSSNPDLVYGSSQITYVA